MIIKKLYYEYYNRIQKNAILEYTDMIFYNVRIFL